MRNRNQIASKFRLYAIGAVAIVLVLGMLVGALFFFRPKKSDVERRTLTKFPKLSAQRMLNGGFFKDVSTWYADTYPGRDGLIAVNNKFQNTYGFETQEKLVTKVKEEADEIPVKKKTAKAEDVKEEVDPPKPGAVDKDVQDTITNGLYIKDGIAYNIYYFYQEGVDQYAGILNSAAKLLKDKTNVYSVLAPTNTILLDQETQEKLGGSDQEQTLKYYDSKYSKDVHMVNMTDIFKKHKDDYLFFNTDHHWTADGAYYAYKQFCKEKGIKAHKKSYFKKQDDYKPFLGTYYQELKDETLGNNPDTVHVYVPNGTNESKSVTKDGVEFDSQVIKDDTFDEANKYMAFLGGDQRLTTIVNDAVEDDSACVLLCDSYGNAFAPFLVDHYHTVYVKDFRYTDPNIVDFCVQNNVTDLIVLNTMKISSAKSTLAQLQIDLLGQ